MATLNQIRAAMHAQPFRPFAIQMADGRTYVVRHPDFVAIPQTVRGREIVFFGEGEDPETPPIHHIDLGLVLEIIVPAPAPAPAPASD
ncbi:MAG: hypothetical protein ACLQIB_05205 [Isosphaeraceae bacterium]